MARRRKAKTHVRKEEDLTQAPPRSFIVKSGDVGHLVSQLIHDLRKVMSPNTADKLRERKTNKIRDYVALAGPLKVSHLIMLNRSETSLNMRLGRIPRGPTATFKITSYSLIKDISHILKSPKSFCPSTCLHAPLLVLNQFPMHVNQYKLLSTVLHALFPPIVVTDQNLHVSSIRRVVLFNYVQESDSIEFRHYAIDVKALGVSKGVRNILGGTRNPSGVPNLSEFSDIAEFITRETNAIESDIEDSLHENQVELPQPDRAPSQRAIKLTELGPRMDLSLTKIQTGLCSGEVLYHRHITKSDAEIEAQHILINKRNQLRAERKALQDANVARKAQAAAAKKSRFDPPEVDDADRESAAEDDFDLQDVSSADDEENSGSGSELESDHEPTSESSFRGIKKRSH